MPTSKGIPLNPVHTRTYTRRDTRVPAQHGREEAAGFVLRDGSGHDDRPVQQVRV